MRFLIALFPHPDAGHEPERFQRQAAGDQSAYVSDFIDKMASDLGAKNPQLGAGIRDYFSRKMEGKPVSEDVERLYVQLAAAELQAKDGKVDLSKVQLESVIVWVVKQKFPPPAK